jgi:hypothetical protein
VAPPFPYQLIGQLTQGDQLHALLNGPNRTLSVQAGDVVDGLWKVERVDPGGLVLVWLPAQLRQTIAFRSVS